MFVTAESWFCLFFVVLGVEGKSAAFSCQGQCTAIRDVDDGWQNNCHGLTNVNQSTTREWCRVRCCEDATCLVWQFGGVGVAAEAVLSECWTGAGTHCQAARSDGFVVLAGQRVTRGTVTGTPRPGQWWCTGYGMVQQTFTTVQTEATREERCRDVCYSDNTCEIWQYSQYFGCWYGSTDNNLMDDCVNGTTEASTLLGGETVTRVCQTVDTHVVPGSPVSYRHLLLGGVLVFMVGLAAILCCSMRAQSRRSTRAKAQNVSSQSEDEELEADASSGDEAAYFQRSTIETGKARAPTFQQPQQLVPQPYQQLQAHPAAY